MRIKKIKSHKIQHLEINAELMACDSPRPGWHRNFSIADCRWGESWTGLAFSTETAVCSEGSEPEEGAMLKKTTSQQPWELSTEYLAWKLSCSHWASTLWPSWVLWSQGTFRAWWLRAQDMATKELLEGDPRVCSGTWQTHCPSAAWRSELTFGSLL